MAQFVRAGDRLINLDNVVEIRVREAKESYTLTAGAKQLRPKGDVVPARPLRVDIVTTATTSSYDDGGDFPESKHTDVQPYGLTLWEEEAAEFLGRVYVPSDNARSRRA